MVLTMEREPRRIFIPYRMWRGILSTRMRKRLRYLMPSLSQSLRVRLLIPRVLSPQCWKIGRENRINLP